MTPPDPGPADLSQTVKDVFGAVSDAANGGEHLTTDVGQVFGDIGKLIADEANQGHTGDSKVVLGDIDNAMKDFFHAISDTGKGVEHAFDDFGKVAGDLGKLVNDLEHDGQQPVNHPDVLNNQHNGDGNTLQGGMTNDVPHNDQHNGDPSHGGMTSLGDVHGFDAHPMHDAHGLHH
jgi:hypothetical protein